MKRTLSCIAAFTAVLLVFGCASGSSRGQILGRYGDPMPDWVRDVPVEEGDAMYFVTSGGRSGTTQDKIRDATSNAHSEFSLYIAGRTETLIKNYSERAGEGDNTQSLQSLKTGIINRASASTSGIRRTASWEATDGEYWALFVYDKTLFRGDIRAEVQNFQRNPAAAYAHFQADNFFVEMERALHGE